jgi:hypothetical protein
MNYYHQQSLAVNPSFAGLDPTGNELGIEKTLSHQTTTIGQQ